jgi:high-affinity nickel permease
MTLLAILVLGFFLGMRHATDADHVVAVTTIVSRERSAGAALWIGAFWGLGHSVTILAVGGAIVVLGLVIPPRLGLSMEMSVAVMLVVLGMMNVTGAMRRVDEAAHGASSGTGDSGKTHALSSARSHGLGRALRPLLVGIVHGLAGSAAVALLVLATIRDPKWALLYLVIFGAGTVLGMMLLTGAMIVPLAALTRRYGSVELVMSRITGLVSIAFGLFLAYKIGIVDGLFRGTPTWNPG